MIHSCANRISVRVPNSRNTMATCSFFACQFSCHRGTASGGGADRKASGRMKSALMTAVIVLPSVVGRSARTSMEKGFSGSMAGGSLKMLTSLKLGASVSESFLIKTKSSAFGTCRVPPWTMARRSKLPVCFQSVPRWEWTPRDARKSAVWSGASAPTAWVNTCWPRRFRPTVGGSINPA